MVSLFHVLAPQDGAAQNTIGNGEPGNSDSESDSESDRCPMRRGHRRKTRWCSNNMAVPENLCGDIQTGFIIVLSPEDVFAGRVLSPCH